VPISLLVAALAVYQPEVPVPDSISVPRSWLLGKERSTVRVRPADVAALLGPPEFMSSDAWLVRCTYRSGVWLDWEYPAVVFCPVERLWPEAAEVLRAWPRGWLRPVARLLVTPIVPAPSLLEVGWAGGGLRFAWRFER
jgi:hypothetical protein